jgi:type VI secretion system protein ImpB
VGDRDVVRVTAETFESILASSGLEAAYTVPNRLREDGSELRVRLSFSSLRSFEPEAVAEQVPELRRMVAMRALLQDLRNRVVSTSAFRRQLEAVLRDRTNRSHLERELRALVAAPSDRTDASSDAPPAGS